MSEQTVLQHGAEVLIPWTDATNEPEPNRLDVMLEASNLVAAVQALLVEAHWGYLSAITGVDLGAEAGEIEVLYHFCSGAYVLTLRVRTPRDNPSVPSLYSVLPSVSFYERELMEMFGITVAGTPNTDRLILPEDWPDGVYPLRKDFSLSNLTPGEKKG